MSSPLTDYIDPRRLCVLGKVYEGEVALGDLPRRAPMVSSQGSAVYRLAFDRDTERRAVIAVDVRADLVLTCQRCLSPMTFDVVAQARLAVVAGPDEAARLPDNLDPLWVEDDRILLRDLVEDELILAVPVAPRHRSDDCAVRLNELKRVVDDENASPDDDKPAPFAALAALKRDGHD